MTVSTYHRDPDREYSDGVITGRHQGNHLRVALDDGREIVAVLPKSSFRKIGCIFGDFAGYRVTGCSSTRA